MIMKLTCSYDRDILEVSGKAEDLTARLKDFWKRVKKADVPEQLQKDLCFALMDGKILKTSVEGVSIYLR